jgi:hypothetical protein
LKATTSSYAFVWQRVFYLENQITMASFLAAEFPGHIQPAAQSKIK